MSEQPSKPTPEPWPWAEIRALQKEEQVEVFKQVFQHGHAAAKVTVLLNGGAAVAVLAFLGNVLSKGDVSGAFRAGLGVVSSLKWYLAGLTAGGFVNAMTYLSQAGFAVEFWVGLNYVKDGRGRWAKLAPFFQLGAVLGFLASMVCFVAGGLTAANSLGAAFSSVAAASVSPTATELLPQAMPKGTDAVVPPEIAKGSASEGR